MDKILRRLLAQPYTKTVSGSGVTGSVQQHPVCLSKCPFLCRNHGGQEGCQEGGGQGCQQESHEGNPHPQIMP